MIDYEVTFYNSSINKIKMNHIKLLPCGFFIGIDSSVINVEGYQEGTDKEYNPKRKGNKYDWKTDFLGYIINDYLF